MRVGRANDTNEQDREQGPDERHQQGIDHLDPHKTLERVGVCDASLLGLLFIRYGPGVPVGHPHQYQAPQRGCGRSHNEQGAKAVGGLVTRIVHEPERYERANQASHASHYVEPAEHPATPARWNPVSL